MLVYIINNYAGILGGELNTLWGVKMLRGFKKKMGYWNAVWKFKKKLIKIWGAGLLVDMLLNKYVVPECWVINQKNSGCWNSGWIFF